MASSSTKCQYLLPGERTTGSPIVHHHGICKTVLSISPQQSPENNLIFTSRIYKPKENDFVIGIVLVRTPDLFLVDINSTEPAILPTTSFNHGCLPSRQAMNRLSVVCARVVRTDSWAQTEVSCQTNNYSMRKSSFGLVEEGYILRCSLALCIKLQKSQLIGHFNRIVKNFCIFITQNGFVWYITDTMNSMIAVKNIICQHEVENDTNRLIDLYKILMTKLEQQNDSLIESKQQQVMKVNVGTKQIDT